jgi:hypothetical protein
MPTYWRPEMRSSVATGRAQKLALVLTTNATLWKQEIN